MEEVNTSENLKDTSPFKRRLTTVTILSKYIALFLFVALPFIGFWVGLNYQMSENINLDSKAPENVTSKEEQHAFEKTEPVPKRNHGVLSIVEFPIQESPIYKQLPPQCYDDYSKNSSDYKLVRNMTEVWVPSLLQLIGNIEEDERACWVSVSFYSQQNDGKYIYIKSNYTVGTDKPMPEFASLYKLNTSTLELNKLSIGDFLRSYDLYRPGGKDSEILKDGKTVIKWDMGGVYKIDLEKDLQTILYEPPENQWLISEISYGMGQSPEYGVYVHKNTVHINIYDKTTTENDEEVTINEFDSVKVLSDDWIYEDGIKLKYIDTVKIQL